MGKVGLDGRESVSYDMAKRERAERRRAVLLVPDLGTSRVLSLAQGLGCVVPGRGTSASGASCLSCAAGRFGRGLQGSLAGDVNRAVFLALVLVACLEPVDVDGTGENAWVSSSYVAGDGLIGSWFVMGKGAHVHVVELVRRLVSTSAGLALFQGRTAACVVREMCRVRGSRAHVVAAALLRVADLLLVGDGGGHTHGNTDGSNADDGVMLLVSCFSCVVDAVRRGDCGVFDAAWKEGLGALDECLLVASMGAVSSPGRRFTRAVARSGSLERLRQYLDQVSKMEAVMGDAELVGAVFRLRTRLLLVDGAIEHLENCEEGTGPTPLMTPSVHEAEALVDDVLFWGSSHAREPIGDGDSFQGVEGGGSHGSSHERDHLAYVAWIACSTLFDPNLPVFNPNPTAYSKLLCRALAYCETTDHACFPPVAWVLASRVDDPVEQRAVLAVNTDELGHRKVSMETIRGIYASAAYAWVETRMLLAGNKLAVDDASRRGIVVGQAQEATLGTIRTLLFPCFLFCPYATLHMAFRTSIANRNDAWLLVAVCDVFPDMLHLPALGGDSMCLPALVEDDEIHVERELARLLVDRILSGASSGAASDPSHDDDESFLYAARALLQAPDRNIFAGDSTVYQGINRGTLWACLPRMLQAPLGRLELASGFVLDVVGRKSADIDRFTSTKLISTCLNLLEFDARYRCLGQDATAFSKRVLDNARKIVASIVDAGTDSVTGMTAELYATLVQIESSGEAPWARLYFGTDFSEHEARYILRTNPKPSLGLTTHVKSVTNIRLHQTLELTALGSIQRAELQDLAAGYTSMSRFLADLQASIRCLFSVCTSTEVRHLMTGLEIFCSTLFTRERSWRTAPGDTTTADDSSADRPAANPITTRTVSACSTAMVAELCLKSMPNAQDVPSVVPDICQYCISSASHLQQERGLRRHWHSANQHPHSLTSRLFKELLNHYATQLRRNPTGHGTTDHQATTALETALSVLYHHRLAPLTRTTFPDPTATPEFILALLQST